MSIVDSSQNPTSFIQTLQMLADPSEVQRRFQALSDKQAEVERLLALVGPANEIIAMRDSIAADLAEARKVKAVAEEEALQIAKRAEVARDAMEEAAAKELDTAKAAAQALLDAAQTKSAEADKKWADAERQQAVLSDKMLEVNAEISRTKRLGDEHEDAKRGYQRSLQSLQEIASQFSTVLGKF
jgi:chromosome segregation ATPase